MTTKAQKNWLDSLPEDNCHGCALERRDHGSEPLQMVEIGRTLKKDLPVFVCPECDAPGGKS